MTPTAKLRFVERFRPVIGNKYGGTIRVLQQWWEQKGMTMNLGWSREVSICESKGEWRDVPLEKENE
jgi:hypothetical protein